MRWKLSTYLCNQVAIYGFNKNHPAFKTNRSSGVATISVNPNTRSKGATTIGINPARHTSQANASGGEEDMIGIYMVVWVWLRWPDWKTCW